MKWSRLGEEVLRRRYLWVTAVVAVVLVAVYSVADPCRELMPRCPFKWLTGFDCPACGNQRALYALLHGDWAGAWRYNPFVWLAAPYALLVVFTEYDPSRVARRWKRRVQHPVTVTLFAAVTLVWWVARNVI